MTRLSVNTFFHPNESADIDKPPVPAKFLPGSLRSLLGPTLRPAGAELCAKMTGMTVSVHLVRHGEVYNPDKILYGRLPGFGLSDLGQRMAHELVEWWEDKPAILVADRKSTGLDSSHV